MIPIRLEEQFRLSLEKDTTFSFYGSRSGTNRGICTSWSGALSGWVSSFYSVAPRSKASI